MNPSSAVSVSAELSSGKPADAKLTRFILPAVLAAASYPLLMIAFAAAQTATNQTHDLASGALALVIMLLAFSSPALSIRALLYLRRETRAAARKTLFYVAFAVPSLFSLYSTISYVAGLGPLLAASVWMVLWLIASVVALAAKTKQPRPGNSSGIRAWRITHGITAAALLLGFIGMHLANHDLALWSARLHGQVLHVLRLWYRSLPVEPILLALFAVMVVTGVRMVAHYARSSMDGFRTLQTATGVYISIFLASHVTATMLARVAGVETDWTFAAGPTSLLDGSLLCRLVPHYFCAALFLAVHVACGLRIVLLQHKTPANAANGAAFAVIVAGLLVTLALMAPLLGIHLGSA
jgi:succinate dehydrogenase/fumarate reductase cytochrome b subunit